MAGEHLSLMQICDIENVDVALGTNREGKREVGWDGRVFTRGN